MEKIKLWIDTDIGDDIDDAYALALALASPEIEPVGVSTVYKNAKQRAYIAKSLLCAEGSKQIPVYAGLDAPEREPIKIFGYESRNAEGKANLRHFNKSMEEFKYDGDDAVGALLDAADQFPNELTVLGIGPLTNLAAAYKARPQSFAKIKQILLMSGFFVEQYPEWNVICDPEAARTVYACGLPIKIVGANVTCKTEVFEEDEKKLLSIGGEEGKLLKEMLRIWLSDNHRNAVMHDGLALSCLYADYVKFEKQNIFVPLEEGARGYTLRIHGAPSPVISAVEVSVGVDEKGFMNSLTERLHAHAKT